MKQELYITDLQQILKTTKATLYTWLCRPELAKFCHRESYWTKPSITLTKEFTENLKKFLKNKAAARPSLVRYYVNWVRFCNELENTTSNDVVKNESLIL